MKYAMFLGCNIPARVAQYDASARAVLRELDVQVSDIKEFMQRLGVIDEIISEPDGGAHMDPPRAAELAAAAIRKHLKELRRVKPDVLLARRFKKFRAMGQFVE